MNTFAKLRAAIRHLLERRTLPSFLVFCVLSLLGLSIAVWGINHDLQQIRLTFLQSEIGRIRSHAIRTVANIQDEMHLLKNDDMAALDKTNHPRRNWNRTFKQDESRLYAAVVDAQGKIVLHYNRDLENQILPPAWYKTSLREEDGFEDVVMTDTPALTSGKLAYDVQVPIIIQDRTIGTYHSGLNSEWFEQDLAEKQSLTKSVWVWLLLAMLMFEIFAGVTLFFASRRIAILNETTKLSRTRRYAEIGQLMAGIAHEIRNPLNAMRLNVHILERAESPEERSVMEAPIDRPAMLHDTKLEIDRVEGLLRILLGYARPDSPRPELLDVQEEIQTTLNFLNQSLEQREILVVIRKTEQKFRVEMDRDRFRQIMFNLLNNAAEAMTSGGTIEITLNQIDGHLEISISDQGEGIPVALRERVFEPFFSTKSNGSGLGLAIVRRHLEDVGGEIHCRSAPSGGAKMCVKLPLHSTSAASTSLTKSN